jgi:hypothetical protein
MLEVEYRRYIVGIRNPDITSESNGLGFKNVYKSMDKVRYFPVSYDFNVYHNCWVG